MKKRGFTLVELLAVLVVLGLLAVIIIPTVSGMINNSREGAYKKQIHVLETAAEKWALENNSMLPDASSNEILAVDFNTLYTSGQITDYPIINPKTGESLEGCILITYNTQYKQYEYKYNNDVNKCND